MGVAGLRGVREAECIRGCRRTVCAYDVEVNHYGDEFPCCHGPIDIFEFVRVASTSWMMVLKRRSTRAFDSEEFHAVVERMGPCPHRILVRAVLTNSFAPSMWHWWNLRPSLL